MAKSSSEKLAKALRANLKRRKGSKGQAGPQEGHAAMHAPETGSRKDPTGPRKDP